MDLINRRRMKQMRLESWKSYVNRDKRFHTHQAGEAVCYRQGCWLRPLTYYIQTSSRSVTEDEIKWNEMISNRIFGRDYCQHSKKKNSPPKNIWDELSYESKVGYHPHTATFEQTPYFHLEDGIWEDVAISFKEYGARSTLQHARRTRYTSAKLWECEAMQCMNSAMPWTGRTND